jgi:hypothetical protein
MAKAHIDIGMERWAKKKAWKMYDFLFCHQRIKQLKQMYKLHNVITYNKPD